MLRGYFRAGDLAGDPFPAEHPKRRAIRCEPVGDDTLRLDRLAAKQLLQQFQRCSRVAPLLHDEVKNLTLIINCVPQVHALSADLLAEVGFYRKVRTKHYDSMLSRTFVGTRTQLIKLSPEPSNQFRRLMKTFGLVLPKGIGRVFEANVRRLPADTDGLARIVLPLLDAWRSIRDRAAELDRQVIADARNSAPCQLLMSIPGVSVVTATSFTAAIEDPENFKTLRAAGAWLGLTTRRHQSGEVDHNGHVRCEATIICAASSTRRRP